MTQFNITPKIYSILSKIWCGASTSHTFNPFWLFAKDGELNPATQEILQEQFYGILECVCNGNVNICDGYIIFNNNIDKQIISYMEDYGYKSPKICLDTKTMIFEVNNVDIQLYEPSRRRIEDIIHTGVDVALACEKILMYELLLEFESSQKTIILQYAKNILSTFNFEPENKLYWLRVFYTILEFIQTHKKIC